MSEKNAHILIIDDEKNYLLVLQTLLEDEGYTVTALSDPETALAFLQESEVDVVVTDMKMPRITGLDVLERVKKQWPYIPVLIMTAFGTIESAVETMKYGAFDYITKPFSNDELLLSIHNAVELAQAHREYKLLQEAMQERFGLHTIIGRSAGISQVKLMVERAAPGRTTVLITGESGTGKELAARAIHAASARAERPFVSLNCAALPESLIESELFGHEKGAFTGATSMRKGRFEQADGGTLFLDEVGELSMMTQAKLLRVLQERSFERLGGMETIRVDVRVITATNRNLEKMVAEGTFRRDLFYRLNVFPIVLPPLRDRQDDILPLASHFVGHFARQAGKGDVRISLAAMDMLQRYSWPGNIRELENAMERAVLLVGSQNLILPQHLPPAMHTESVNMADEKQRKMPHMAATLEQRMDELERACIVDAMEATGGQINRAAQQLGLTQRVLALRLKKYGLSYKEYRRSGREQAGK